MELDKRKGCDLIIASMNEHQLSLEDLLIHSLLNRKEQLLQMLQSNPTMDETLKIQEELSEVRNQLLAFGE